jgi:hypothetical protein
MQLKQTLTVEVKSDDVYFDLFEVESVAAGTLIRAKSKKFGAWFKSLQDKQKVSKANHNKAWVNATFSVPTQIIADNVPGARSEQLNYSVRSGLFLDGQPNMVWIFHGDLEAGWELLVPEPLSLNNLEDFFTTSIDDIRDMYLKHLRAGKFSAVLSEVVNE